jgi:endopeptidase La
VQLLETIDLEDRLELALLWARETLADLELKDRIRSEVTDGIDAQQREMLLRRQMDAIRKELGEGEEDAVAEYRTRAAELDLPESVRAAVDKELDKFERMGAQNPEQAWVRNWLDAVLDIPWGTQVDEHSDLDDARSVLDSDHDGLDDVKERILEFLAVRVLRRERGLATAESGRGSGAILALVGPPGVGKTSLGESVARALGRPFVRIAVGGVRDEAEIRGHRRTYVGARPGRIVRGVDRGQGDEPVVLIDEVDKLQAGGWSGDPASALLEVLDPAQNHTFRDHYLELDLDLSDVLFLATANVLDTIPGPLLDRMELCSSTATPRTRRSRSPSITCSRASGRRRGCERTSSTSPTPRSTRWLPGGRERGRCSRSRASAGQGRAQGRAPDRDRGHGEGRGQRRDVERLRRPARASTRRTRRGPPSRVSRRVWPSRVPVVTCSRSRSPAWTASRACT